jgi:hypothetical protein
MNVDFVLKFLTMMSWKVYWKVYDFVLPKIYHWYFAGHFFLLPLHEFLYEFLYRFRTFLPEFHLGFHYGFLHGFFRGSLCGHLHGIPSRSNCCAFLRSVSTLKTTFIMFFFLGLTIRND